MIDKKLFAVLILVLLFNVSYGDKNGGSKTPNPDNTCDADTDDG